MTTVVISQPMYFPWVGFLGQLALADVMIWLDDAQFSKGSFTNRVQVKTQSGTKWMTIPLQGKGLATPINSLASANSDWKNSHRSLILQSLRANPFCEEALSCFDKACEETPVVDLLIASAELLGMSVSATPSITLRSSDMAISGKGWERVLNLVQEVGGTEYITGHGAQHYLDHGAFDKAGIEVRYMAYNPKPWPQKFGDFSPYVTGLDLISATPSNERASYIRPDSVHWKQFLEQQKK